MSVNVFRPVQSNPESFTVYGQALLDNGMLVLDGISGAGLVTRGFIWTAYDVWFNRQLAAPISTSWTSSNASITTNWTSSNASITTTWTPSHLGPYGEYFS